ncbi:hypothetical protein C3F09_11065 [candidate division GN15 bacterium]|uniref:TonB C-terminal domain-containing protein n=1 Tax=candidate division GN15 bacterium TaxID=2072418 RepID=A0A855X3Y0_9BACT|nr:MAG: hypothetical protein C3F09_11065 [candidate division GN15 bacterium]
MKTTISNRLLLVVALVCATTLCSPVIEADDSDPNLPLEIRDLTEENRSDPPQTILPLGPAYGRVPDTTVAVVWIRFKADRKGYAKDIQIAYSSRRNFGFEERAAIAFVAGSFKKPKFSGRQPYKTLYHEIVFKKLPSDTVRAPEACASVDSESLGIGVETFPEMISNAQPKYPAMARRAGIGGTVWVKSLIDCEGSVRMSVIGRSSGSAELDTAALTASYNNKFSPGFQQRKPVACWVTYQVRFK